MPRDKATAGAATSRNLLTTSKNHLKALASLPAMQIRLRELETQLTDELAHLSARVDALEGSLGAIVSGKDAQERQQREDALLNQIVSVPVAIRELSVRLHRLENETAELTS